jgi:hypothetical protein
MFHLPAALLVEIANDGPVAVVLLTTIGIEKNANKERQPALLSAN